MRVGWRRRAKHFGTHFLDDIREQWPAAIAVACIIAIGHHQWAWMYSIDRYAFLAFGPAGRVEHVADLPLLRWLGAHSADEPQSVVVKIDEEANERRYFDRSPFYRCALRDDLKAVYEAVDAHNRRLVAAGPLHSSQDALQTVVIDLDISPSLWVRRRSAAGDIHEDDCERQLYELIKAYGDRKRQGDSPYPIYTVLMQPTPLDTDKAAQEAWVNDMQSNGVLFGDPGLNVENGFVTRYDCNPESLPAMAFRHQRSRQNLCVRQYVQGGAREPPDKAQAEHFEREWINPKYQANVLVRTPDRLAGFDCAPPTRSSPCPVSGRVKAVFFGAAFGETDRYLSPIGERYGVEVHAATYLSLLAPLSAMKPFLGLGIDVLYSFLFGACSGYLWKRYFRAKMASSAAERLTAPVYVAALMLLVLLLAAILSVACMIVLIAFGVWSSPLPIAIGMLIEGFAAGAIAEAVRAHRSASGIVRPRKRTFGESVSRFLYGDTLRLLDGKAHPPYRLAALLSASWTLLWLALVLVTILILSSH